MDTILLALSLALSLHNPKQIRIFQKCLLTSKKFPLVQIITRKFAFFSQTKFHFKALLFSHSRFCLSCTFGHLCTAHTYAFNLSNLSFNFKNVVIWNWVHASLWRKKVYLAVNGMHARLSWRRIQGLGLGTWCRQSEFRGNESTQQDNPMAEEKHLLFNQGWMRTEIPASFHQKITQKAKKLRFHKVHKKIRISDHAHE